MRKILIALMVFYGDNLSGQINLVPNPSFEDTVTCPQFNDQLDLATGWSSFRGTPDYFNMCSTTGLAPPNIFFGFQSPNTGNSMIGMGTYRNPNSPNGPNYREFAGVQLQSPTVPGQKYYLSFFVNFAFGPSISVATNNIGCVLSPVQYSNMNPAPINNQSLLHMGSILTDSINWIKVSGSFVAAGSFQYLIIGNFYDDSNTDTLNVRPANDYSYYYIDDVCVSTDSLTCNTTVGINEITNNNTLSIYPNPTSKQITLSFTRNVFYAARICVFNLLGEQVYEQPAFIQKQISIPVYQLPAGIYIMEVSYEGKKERLKFVRANP